MWDYPLRRLGPHSKNAGTVSQDLARVLTTSRLAWGFSKSLDHLKAALDLYMAFFNLCRVDQSLCVTPAMQARITDDIWTVRELLEMS
jgi:hypothetical protein